MHQTADNTDNVENMDRKSVKFKLNTAVCDINSCESKANGMSCKEMHDDENKKGLSNGVIKRSHVEVVKFFTVKLNAYPPLLELFAMSL